MGLFDVVTGPTTKRGLYKKDKIFLNLLLQPTDGTLLPVWCVATREGGGQKPHLGTVHRTLVHCSMGDG